MRIHLGHHFYGAGNLGDDFMLAGFLAAMSEASPRATFTSCVPFPLDPLRRRFPNVDWQPYDDATRTRLIGEADAWLGLGGSPFQSAQSRWFVDHLIQEAADCGRANVPMFNLGVGVQTAAELNVPEIRDLCAQAKAIWTRDAASADRLRALGPDTRIDVAADLAHVFFELNPPPAARRGRVTVVANFDFGTWPGQTAALAAIDTLAPSERIWLAQEVRELPGAEKALYGSLTPADQAKWRFVAPDESAAAVDGALRTAVSQWLTGEWLVSSRYHAAIAGVWAGSKVVVVGTNEKLNGLARELGLTIVPPEASQRQVESALRQAAPVSRPVALAEKARAACRALVEAIAPRFM